MVNSRGDVVALFDSTGKELARYNYDAWGNCTVTTPTGTALTDTNHIANVNPLRYRGYYLDTDTGLYYLQSRYYDPVTHRMLNADDESIATDDLTALSDKNLFVYCDNNPLIRVDGEGEFWHFVIGTAVGAVVGAASTIITNVATGQNWSDGLLGATIGGAASGFVASTGVGWLASIGWNAAIGAGAEGINQVQKKQSFQLDGAGIVRGALMGALGGAVGGPGYGSASLKAASKQLTKRVGNAMRYSKSFSSGAKEIRKAVTNYAKKTVKTTWKGASVGILLPAGTNTVVNSGYYYYSVAKKYNSSKQSMGYYYSTGRR